MRDEVGEEREGGQDAKKCILQRQKKGQEKEVRRKRRQWATEGDS